jgi:RimJ/RimL family protein N-acetyltransferase
VTGLVRVDNIEARRFDENLGFVQEGIIRRGADDGTDMILYGMLKEECRWLELANEIKRPL